MKECTKCRENKVLTDFYKKGNRYHAECKGCFKERTKQWIHDHPEKAIKYRKTNYQNNKEKEYNKRLDVREKRKISKKRYYQLHRREILEALKAKRPQTNSYQRNRRRTDMNYRLLCNLRSRLNSALKGKCKNSTTKELLGCDMSFFRKWIEYQFSSEMSWDNYGIFWELDHVTPCAFFDLCNDQQVAECFNWKNIRPLCCSENNIKSDKYDKEIISRHHSIVDFYDKTLS